MARIFNIYFNYDDILHSAIVSVRSTPFFTEYTLGNLDEGLQSLLPDTRLFSQTPDHLFFQNMTTEHSVLLMNEIIKTIVRHLHSGNDVSFEV